MRTARGQSLIELMIFIIMIGFFVAGSMSAIKTVLFYSNKPSAFSTASQLANARMNLILQQRRINGFDSLTDPCSSGSLAACSGLNSFASSGGYVISSSISAASDGVRTATVTVTGAGYATNIERFNQ